MSLVLFLLLLPKSVKSVVAYPLYSSSSSGGLRSNCSHEMCLAASTCSQCSHNTFSQIPINVFDGFIRYQLTQSPHLTAKASQGTASHSATPAIPDSKYACVIYSSFSAKVRHSLIRGHHAAWCPRISDKHCR
jgi:hypothetical protein